MSEEKNKNNMSPLPEDKKAFNEELEVAGSQLVEQVRNLLEQGNIRRLIIRDQESRVLLEIPLTIGAVAGGALLVFYPLLAGLAVVGGLVAKLRIEIVRVLDDEATTPEALVDKNDESV